MRLDASVDEQHGFQLRMCERYGKPILNVASHDDPAMLGERFDAVNLDATVKFDSGASTAEVKNFVHGDAMAMPADWTGRFATVVLGEYLEHCDLDVAVTTLKECARVCRPDGVIVVTFPLDDRPKEEQHTEPDKFYWVNSGFSSWHRTVWTDPMLADLFSRSGLAEVSRADLLYPLTKVVPGWGIVLRKSG